MDVFIQNLLVTHKLWHELWNARCFEIETDDPNCEFPPDTQIIKIIFNNHNQTNISLLNILTRGENLVGLLIIAKGERIKLNIDYDCNKLRLLALIPDGENILQNYRGLNEERRTKWPFILNNIHGINSDGIHLYGCEIERPVNFTASTSCIIHSKLPTDIMTYTVRSGNNCEFNYHHNEGCNDIILHNRTSPLSVTVDVLNLRINSQGPTRCKILGRLINGLFDFINCPNLIDVNDQRVSNNVIGGLIRDYRFPPGCTATVYFDQRLDPQIYEDNPNIIPFCDSGKYDKMLSTFVINEVRTPENIMTLLKYYYPKSDMFDYNVDYSRFESNFDVVSFNPYDQDRIDYMNLSFYNKCIYNINWWRNNKNRYQQQVQN